MSDGDPFVSRRPQMGSLGIRAALANQQQGVMSRQLAALTHGGTRKPTIEEALDQNNLPFVEYCRKAKADEFGVIRIKNVCLFLLQDLSQAVAAMEHSNVVNTANIFRSPTLSIALKFLPSSAAMLALLMKSTTSLSISSWNASPARLWTASSSSSISMRLFLPFNDMSKIVMAVAVVVWANAMSRLSCLGEYS